MASFLQKTGRNKEPNWPIIDTCLWVEDFVKFEKKGRWRLTDNKTFRGLIQELET